MKFYTLILDRSGSMATIWEPITKAVNDHLKEKSKGALCSLEFFDTGGLEFLFKYQNNPGEVNTDNFKPRGCTPLRDAIMFGVETLIKDWGEFLFQEWIDVEFTIFTDGEENSSRFWKSEDVARTINHFQDSYGWKFSFIGQGEQSDVVNYAKQFGVRTENVISFKEKSDLTQIFSKV